MARIRIAFTMDVPSILRNIIKERSHLDPTFGENRFLEVVENENGENLNVKFESSALIWEDEE